MKKYLFILLLIPILLISSCTDYDPLTDDLYIKGTLYTWNGTAYNAVNTSLGGGDVVGINLSDDNAIARYDGATGKRIQNSLATINDFGTINAPAYTGGNIQVTGKVQGDRLIGDIEGYSIDVVQASDLDIAVNDTLDIVFLFEPNVIVLDFSARVKHDTTYEVGHTTGHCVIIVTGVDTITYNLNTTTIYDNNGSMSMTAIQDSTTRVVWAYGGNDGVDDSYINATAGWDTGTHTLTLTFVTVSNTLDNNNYVEIVATAYR